MALPPGTTVDRYILEGVLGEGGMAVVYAARHRDLGSLHAIKQLRIQNPDIRERLLQEGRLQSGLRHPNVVSVTDLITIEGVPALVMEYVQGPTLAQLLRERRPSLVQCDAIARGILKGVAAAHGHGMVHRDLKPANILVASTDSEVIPKIADFGLAKLLEGEGDAHGLTQEGAAMGTPGYMAPEQINDASNVDRRADVFSLGAILYELVSGELCFQGKGIMDVWSAISQGEFVAPKERVPSLPDRMVNAIEGALVVDREQRISLVSELIDVWCTDANGSFIPILSNSSNRFDEDSPQTLAHSLTIAAHDSESLPFEVTQLSMPEPQQTGHSDGAAAGAIPSLVATTVSQSTKRSWWLFGSAVLLVVLSALWWGHDGGDTEQRARGSLRQDVDGPLIALNTDAESSEHRTFTKAQQALLDGEFSLTERLLKSLLRTQAQTGQVHSLLSLTYFFQGRLALSAAASQRAARGAKDRNDNMASMILLADRSWREFSKKGTLLHQWDDLRRAHSDNPMLELTYLVSTRFLLGPKEGLAAIRAAGERFSDYAAFAYLEVHSFHTNGQYARWLKAAQLAHLRFPSTSGLLLEVGKAQLQVGQLEAAETTLKKVLAQDGSLVRARGLLANLYVQRNDEAARVQQLMIAMSDTNSPIDQLSFLSDHGRVLATHGRLMDADKHWALCVKEAQSAGNPNLALDCAQGALQASLWLRPAKKWTLWLSRMESILSRPDLEPALREVNAVSLNWYKAVAAARRGELDTVDSLAKSLEAMTGGGSFFNAADSYRRLIRFEAGLLRKNREDVERLLVEMKSSEAVPGAQESCTLMFRRALAAGVFAQRKEADEYLTAIMHKRCSPNPGDQKYVMAASWVMLAKIRLGQRRPADAAVLLDLLLDGWKMGDEDLPLIREAKSLRELLPSKR